MIWKTLQAKLSAARASAIMRPETQTIGRSWAAGEVVGLSRGTEVDVRNMRRMDPMRWKRGRGGNECLQDKPHQKRLISARTTRRRRAHRKADLESLSGEISSRYLEKSLLTLCIRALDKFARQKWRVSIHTKATLFGKEVHIHIEISYNIASSSSLLVTTGRKLC